MFHIQAHFWSNLNIFIQNKLKPAESSDLPHNFMDSDYKYDHGVLDLFKCERLFPIFLIKKLNIKERCTDNQ